jgi:hypothetical protein
MKKLDNYLNEEVEKLKNNSILLMNNLFNIIEDAFFGCINKIIDD